MHMVTVMSLWGPTTGVKTSSVRQAPALALDAYRISPG